MKTKKISKIFRDFNKKQKLGNLCNVADLFWPSKIDLK